MKKFQVIPWIHAEPFTSIDALKKVSSTHQKFFTVRKMTYHQATKMSAICAIDTTLSLYAIRKHDTIKSFLKQHQLRLRKHAWMNHLVNITHPFFILGLNPKGSQLEDVLDYIPVDQNFKEKLRKYSIKFIPTKIS